MMATWVLCMAVGGVLVSDVVSAASEDGSPPRGRWIFRYDRSGEQPPVGRAQPDILGIIMEVAETPTREWGMRVRVEALDGDRRSITVTQSTRVDGRPAKQAAETLAKGVPVAVFGGDVRGEFRASAVFVIPEEDWQEIVADARGADGHEQTPSGAARVPARSGWEEEAEGLDADAGAFPWPAHGWTPRYPIPEVTAPAPLMKRRTTVTPMERARRADISGTIRSIRMGGLELSVATPGAVVIVRLNGDTTVRRDEESSTAADLREGDVVDIAVARWRGSESCIARQVWVVAPETAEAPLTAPQSFLAPRDAAAP
ncbi:MAG: hypothetical protein ACE5JM_12015 [Armatimonadota bacterium]